MLASLSAGLVSVDAQELSIVATSGQEVPGSADSFVSFLDPVIARDGTVGFIALTNDRASPAVDDYGVFTKRPAGGLQGVLVRNPENKDGTFWTLSPDTITRATPFPIDADGRQSGPASFFGVGGSRMVLARAGSLETKAVLGDFVPETGGLERFSAFIGPVVLNDVGQMVFQTTYRFADSASISGGGLRFSEDALTNASTELLPSDAESPDGAGRFGGFEDWSISDTGRVALIGRLFNENQNGNAGITEANGGRVLVQTGESAWTVRATEGTLLTEFPANETVETVIGSLRQFESGFWGVTLNDSGQVAFGASIYDRVPATGATPPPATDNKFFNGLDVARIYLGSAGGELTDVITKGDSAAIFGNASRFITALSRPHLSNGGKIAFIADLGSAADTYEGSGLFTFDSAKPPATAYEAIAKTGDLFQTGLVFSRLGRSTDTGATDFAINNRGQVAFIAIMNVTGDNTLRAGLFLKDTDGTLTLIAREGVVLELVSKLVSEIHLQGGSTASGRAVGLSDNGSVTFRAVFNDGTSAVLVFAPPVPTTQFEWTGALGSDNWHAGAANWKDLVTNAVARNTPGDGEGETVVIQSQDVVLDERAARLKWITASGSLDVQAPLTLEESSVIEDLYLGANLTLDGPLRLTGDGSFWSAGVISGPSTLTNAGSLDFSAPGQTLNLQTGLTILDQAVSTLVSDAIDLGDKGMIEVMPGGLFLLRAGAVNGSALPASITNRGVLRKQDAATLVVDVPSFKNEPTGKIEITAGEFSFEGAGQFAGILETSSGATTRFKSAEVITGSIAGDSLTIRGGGPVLVESSGFQIGAGAETILENNGESGGLILGEGADLFGSGTLRIQSTGMMTLAGSNTDVFAGDLIVDGRLEIASGTLQLDRAVAASGQFDIAGGNLVFNTPGDQTNLFDGVELSVDAGGRISIVDGDTSILGSTTLSGSGEVSLGDPVIIQIEQNAMLINTLADGPLRIGGATIDGAGFDSAPSLKNRGEMILDHGVLRDLVLENESGSGTNPAILRIERNPESVQPPISFSEVQILNGGSDIIRQNISVKAGSGRLTIRNFGLFELDGADLISDPGTVMVETDNLEGFSAGTLIFSGNCAIEGTLNNIGRVIVNEGAKVTALECSQVGSDFDGGSTLENGVWELRNGALRVPIDGSGDLSGPPLRRIGAGAELVLIGQGSDFNEIESEVGFPHVSLKVEGRLRIKDRIFHGVSGPVAFGAGASILNEGLVELDAATIELPPFHLIVNSRLLAGNGLIVGSVFNVGAIEDTISIVSPGFSPGRLEITEDFLNGNAGALAIELGGLEAGNDYDQLIVGGTASLLEGSRITITLIDPNPDDDVDELFIPRTGDVFSFLSAGNIEIPAGMSLADFIEFTNLPEGVDLNLDLAVVDGKTQVTLTADSTLTPPAGPRITVHPSAPATTAGDTVILNVSADGATAFTYQWRLNGVDIPGATEATYTLPFAQRTNNGDYSVVVTADGVSTTSRNASLEVSAPPQNDARLLNLSTRALALTGSDVLIPGFVIEGAGTKALLIRAVGASLRNDPFNISTALENPQMTLRQWNGSAFEIVETNDDWETNTNVGDLSQATMDLGAFPLTDSRDAALFTDLDAGRYTVVARGVGDLTGVAIVELFDADGEASTTVLKNISNRGYVGTGASIMIPGLTVSPEGPKTFLMRVVGPALGQPPFSLTGVLEDPRLTVFSGPDAILTNDNWGDSPDAANTASTAALLGAFPLPEGSKDAAMVVTLPPGGYTIKAAGVEGATGTAIVEVYVVE